MVNIPPIYADDWGMADCCFTHIRLYMTLQRIFTKVVVHRCILWVAHDLSQVGAHGRLADSALGHACGCTRRSQLGVFKTVEPSSITISHHQKHHQPSSKASSTIIKSNIAGGLNHHEECWDVSKMISLALTSQQAETALQSPVVT